MFLLPLTSAGRLPAGRYKFGTYNQKRLIWVDDCASAQWWNYGNDWTDDSYAPVAEATYWDYVSIDGEWHVQAPETNKCLKITADNLFWRVVDCGKVSFAYDTIIQLSDAHHVSINTIFDFRYNNLTYYLSSNAVRNTDCSDFNNGVLFIGPSANDLGLGRIRHEMVTAFPDTSACDERIEASADSSTTQCSSYVDQTRCLGVFTKTQFVYNGRPVYQNSVWYIYYYSEHKAWFCNNHGDSFYESSLDKGYTYLWGASESACPTAQIDYLAWVCNGWTDIAYRLLSPSPPLFPPPVSPPVCGVHTEMNPTSQLCEISCLKGHRMLKGSAGNTSELLLDAFVSANPDIVIPDALNSRLLSFFNSQLFQVPTFTKGD